MFKRQSTAPKRITRGVLRREVDWTTKYMLEGFRDVRWRPCRVLDVSRDGAGLILGETNVPEVRAHRIIIEVEVPPATLRLCGDVRHAAADGDGNVRVGVQFGTLAAIERDMLDSLLERENATPNFGR